MENITNRSSISNNPLPHFRGKIFKPHWLDLLMFWKFMLSFSWVLSSCNYIFVVYHLLSKILIQFDTTQLW
jgi:hypothetical protein